MQATCNRKKKSMHIILNDSTVGNIGAKKYVLDFVVWKFTLLESVRI